MICDFCNEKEAVVFIELQSQGGKRRLNLCMECSERLGVSQEPSSISSLFKELSNISQQISDNDKKTCPVCGTSFSSIKKTHLAGCPECYSIFKNEIRDILSRQGVKERYSGEMPHRLASFRSVLTDRMFLQNKLEESLKREDYEKAAVYRDYLRALEKTPVSGNGDERQS